jgi:hypothetical protein
LATRTFVCPECGGVVPHGRLSCPSCGTLLASVVGGARGAVPNRIVAEQEPPTLLPDDETPRTQGWASDAFVAESQPDAARNVEPVETTATDHPDAGVAEPPAETGLPPAATAVMQPAVASDASALTEGLVPSVLGDWPPSTSDPVDDDDVLAVYRPTTQPAVAPVDEPADPLPPSAILGPATTSPPGAWTPPASGRSAVAGTDDTGHPKPGQASLLADLPFDAPETLGGWLVSIGSGLAVVGFLLPWAARAAYAGNTEGYLGSWGLASPGHWLIFLAALVTFGLSVLPGRLPAWIRDGVLVPILAGGMLVAGLPYLIGPIEAQVGVLVTTAAALLLVAATVLIRWPARHGGSSSSV